MSGCLLMNFRRTWSISPHRLYSSIRILCCLFIPWPLFPFCPHLALFNFIAVYLHCLFCPFLSHLYALKSLLPLHFLRFLSASHLSSLHLTILPSLLFIFCLLLSSLPSCFLSHRLFLHLFLPVPSPPKSFLSVCTHHLPFILHISLSPVLSPPSSSVGQTRVDKMGKKVVLTSEAISIYNQSVCVYPQ